VLPDSRRLARQADYRAPAVLATATKVTEGSSVTSVIAAADGTPLLVRCWSPAGDRWVQMLLVHGLGEHSGRYERAGRLFAEARIDVTAFDLRGHGGSGGRRGDVERWADYLDDIAARLAAVRAEADGRPVVLFGHSYGGLICTDYVLSGRPKPDLLVLSAPALDDGLPRWQHALVPLIARILPTLAFKNAWEPDVLSRDPEVGRRVRMDPSSPDQATTRMGAFGFEAQERVRATLSRLAVPTLVFHGSDDRLVPPTATEPFEKLPVVTRRVYPGLRHESLNEPEGPQVVADIIEWLHNAVHRLR
jgi:alpha-beta hydrolase superfamily lysophospholipase